MRTMIDDEEIVTTNRLSLEIAFEPTGHALVWSGLGSHNRDSMAWIGDEAAFRQAGQLFRAIRERSEIEIGRPK